MLMVAFKVTDNNLVIGFNAETFGFWFRSLDPKGADFFRQQMETNIMPRGDFSYTPGIIFGNLILDNPISIDRNNLLQ